MRIKLWLFDGSSKVLEPNVFGLGLWTKDSKRILICITMYDFQQTEADKFFGAIYTFYKLNIVLFYLYICVHGYITLYFPGPRGPHNISPTSPLSRDG